jgi:hypothetical protein
MDRLDDLDAHSDAAPTAVQDENHAWFKRGQSTMVSGISGPRITQMLDEATATLDELRVIRDENEALRGQVDWLNDQIQQYTWPEPKDVNQPKLLDVHARKDGRWSARVRCPDGLSRHFLAAKREPVDPTWHKPLRQPLPPRVRFAILSRDTFRCRYCGRSADDGAVLQVDHVIAVANGGSDDAANLVTACQDCNLGKSSLEIPPPL